MIQLNAFLKGQLQGGPKGMSRMLVRGFDPVAPSPELQPWDLTRLSQDYQEKQCSTYIKEPSCELRAFRCQERHAITTKLLAYWQLT